MPLPEAFMQELKARCEISEVVASYVNLRHSGRNLVGLCPFHNEKTPSFNVYPENGSFYCFGCGAGGDVITFVRRIENLDYMEAVRFLAQRAGIQVPENQVDDGMARLRARILEINREAARYYYSILNSEQGKAGMDYLNRRALSPNTIRHFGLGYAPASRYSLVGYLEKKGYTQNEMILANVAFKGRSGQAVDRFFSRVMFPIIDLRGNVIAFGGRVLTDEKPKYLNTSDTPVFNKGNFLFALNFAKNSGTEQLILCEGYMDVISMHQAGFTNAVATLGTALTPNQARLMARYTKEVVLSYDSDEAGQKATARAIPILREAGLLVKVLTISGGKDPDEYIRSNGQNGRVKFKQLIDASGNDVEYRLQKIRQGCNIQTPQGRVDYLTGASAVLATLDNPIEQEVYAGKLAEEIGIERTAILQQVRKNRSKLKKNQEQKAFRAFQQQSAGVRDSINPEKVQHLRAASAEEALIAYIVQYPENAIAIERLLPAEKFATTFNRRVYGTIMERIRNAKAVSLTDIAEEFSVEEISSIAKIFAKFHGVSVTMRDAEEYIDVIQQEYEKMSVENVNSAEPQEIQDYLQKLRSQKK
ncbi:DNA primase [Caproiciproducens sp. CPB-2]|uniref:DNA primase n=1 Tax=Caproiciproducens sp. CPB-2 TaxID=3030017 RepID=UPI0023D9EB5E|nr:DNA primase [Caproiciproducens sp. CPB-2]MDF1496172.1 DNA primase [Caproiciproducens sp. CPB-2]